MTIERGNGWEMHLGEAYGVLRSMPSLSIGALITDPPYSSGGFTRGDRTSDPIAKYRRSDADENNAAPTFSGDNRDQHAYLAWCVLWLLECERLLVAGAPVAVWSDWRQLPTTTDAIQAAGLVWRGIGVWTKDNASRPSMGRFRADAEFLAWGSNGPMRQSETVGVLPGSWTCPPVPHALRLHLTEKPLDVMESIVRIAEPDTVVLDPFAGSGTTGVACLRLGRRFIGIEKDPTYFALVVERLRAEEQGSTLQAARAGQEALFK